MKLQQVDKNVWVFPDDATPSDADDAFDDALEEWRAGHTLAIEKKFLAVIKQCPNHIDALHHLALFYEDLGRDAAAYAYWQAAVGIGLRAIPEEFSWSRSKLEWGFHQNRPFMRAFDALGLWFLKHGHYDDAIDIFSKLLAVCPNDNLGVRYLLPECWLARGEPDKVVAHCQAHTDDGGPDIQYTLGLALVMCGKVESAKRVLEDAIATLPLVAKELLKKAHRRPAGFAEGYIVWGGATQAYDYWRRLGKHWAASEKAVHLLKVVARIE